MKFKWKLRGPRVYTSLWVKNLAWPFLPFSSPTAGHFGGLIPKLAATLDPISSHLNLPKIRPKTWLPLPFFLPPHNRPLAWNGSPKFFPTFPCAPTQNRPLSYGFSLLDLARNSFPLGLSISVLVRKNLSKVWLGFWIFLNYGFTYL